jgi:hypothetical protein
MTRELVVTLEDVEANIRAVIRVHVRKAGHKDEDVAPGCETCLVLIALNMGLTRDAKFVEMEP